MRLLLLVASVLALPAAAPAAVVAVQNRTAAAITFAIRHGDDKRQTVTLNPGDSVAVPVGREPTLVVVRKQKNEVFKLDPYTPYVFVPNADSFDFQGVRLSGEMPKPDDVPAIPPDRKPIPVPVSLLVDDRDGRTQMIWEKDLRQRFEAAAAPFAAQLGVQFEIASTAEWKTTQEPGWDHALEHFRTAAPAKPGAMVIGYLAKPVLKADADQFCAVGRPWRGHLLLREAYPRNEAERVDALAQALGRQFGAVRTADPASVMREKLFDGQATKPAYRPRFDPLNLIAMHVWLEEKTGGHDLTWEGLRDKPRARLLVLYKTLAELPSKDPLATEYVEALVASKESANPPSDPMRKLAAREEAIWSVVRAVTVQAKKFADSAKPPKGDDLTLAYVRAAATAADKELDEHAVPALLIGLGIALDDSTILRGNPLTKRLCEKVESDAERKERLAVLGSPTLRGRRDLCQHFAVSAALVQLVGAEAAEFAGLVKEQADAKTASGFSFVDLSADYAGVAFAQALATNPKLVPKLKAEFAVSDWIPAFDGLREGMPEARFKELFGGPDDDRFKNVVKDIRKRVANLPGHKKE